jgi:hypothetical protein
MNAVIVHPEGNPARSYLIDKHALVHAPAPNGKPAHVGLVAIDIRHLKAGELVAIDGHIYPRPCQLVGWEKFTEHDPLWRGIYPDACRALLDAGRVFKTAVEPGRKVTLGQTGPGWNQWQFLTAWAWSLWQARQRAGEEWPLDRRWRELAAVGYPDTFAAFRQVCSRLKLSVTKSAPNM